MITLEQAKQIGKNIVEEAGYKFDSVFFLNADDPDPAMYVARGIDADGEQALEGIDIPKAILAEDGSIIDYVLPVPT